MSMPIVNNAPTENFTPEEVAWAQQNVPPRPSDQDFTPEEIQWAKQAIPDTPSEQIQPQATQQQPTTQPLGLIDSVTQGLNDFTTASAAEAGSLGAGVLANAGKLIGNQTLASFANDQSRLDNIVANAREQSPIMGAIGKWGTDLIGGAALPASSIAQGALSGAAMGLATSTGNDTMWKVGADALLGAGAAGVVKGVSALAPPVSRMLTAGKLWMTDPNTLTNKVLNTALADAGGDINKVTPLALAQQIQGVENKAYASQQLLYKARDAQAAIEGATVGRTNLTNAANDLVSQITTGATDDVIAAYGQARRLLGRDVPLPMDDNTINAVMSFGNSKDEAMNIIQNSQLQASKQIVKNTGGAFDAQLPFSSKDLSFQDAQKQISQLGKNANQAGVTGNLTTQAQLLGLKDALQQDINQSATVSDKLLNLHQVASDYTRDIYKPIANLDVDKAIAARYTDNKLMGTMANKVLDNPPAMVALNQVDPNMHAITVAANVNNLANNATDNVTGKINLRKFSTTLANEVANNKAAYGSSTDDLLNVSKALSVAGGLPQSLNTLKAITKPYFLYGASKLLNNPAVSDLLKTSGALEDYPASSMAKLVNNKITKAFTNAVGDIPTRLLPAFGASAVNTLTQ